MIRIFRRVYALRFVRKSISGSFWFRMMRPTPPILIFALATAALFSYSYQYFGISPGFANFTLIGIPPLMRVVTRKSKSG